MALQAIVYQISVLNSPWMALGERRNKTQQEHGLSIFSERIGNSLFRICG